MSEHAVIVRTREHGTPKHWNIPEQPKTPEHPPKTRNTRESPENITQDQEQHLEFVKYSEYLYHCQRIEVS